MEQSKNHFVNLICVQLHIDISSLSCGGA